MFELLGKWLRAYAEKDGRGYPDWAVRYVPIVRRLRRQGLDTGRVLEIGANENGLARFAKRRVIAVDIAFEHLQAACANQEVLPVQADCSALPFATDTVDICVSMDTLEHVPPEKRTPMASEIVRVMRDTGTAVVTFPAGEAAMQAEQDIQQACRDYTGRSLGWLDEHAACGLPDPDDVSSAFVDAGGVVTRSRNASLFVWRWMWRVLMCGWPGRGNALFQALLRLLTPILCRIHVGVCYRAVIWIKPKK